MGEGELVIAVIESAVTTARSPRPRRMPRESSPVFLTRVREWLRDVRSAWWWLIMDDCDEFPETCGYITLGAACALVGLDKQAVRDRMLDSFKKTTRKKEAA